MSDPSSHSSPHPTLPRTLWTAYVDAADDPLSRTSTFLFLSNFLISGYVLSSYLLPLLGWDFAHVPFGFGWWLLDHAVVILFGFNGWTGWTKRWAALGEKAREAEERMWSEFAEEMRG